MLVGEHHAAEVAHRGAPVEFDVSALDICDGAVEVVCDPPSGALFPIGRSAVICRARDEQGNLSVCAFPVSVLDTRAPTITCVADVVRIECTTAGELWTLPSGSAANREPLPCTTRIAYEEATGVDTCQPPGVAIHIDCNPPQGTRLALGSHQITCRARDVWGNESRCTFTVDIVRGRVLARASKRIAENNPFHE